MSFDRWEVLAGAYKYAILWNSPDRAVQRVWRVLERVGFKPGNDVEHMRVSQRAHETYLRLVKAHEKHNLDGYTNCECRDCFEVTIGGGFCDACVDADCVCESECCAEHEYTEA